MRKHIFRKENKLKRIVAICVVAIMLCGLVAPTFASDAAEQEQEDIQQEEVKQEDIQQEDIETSDNSGQEMNTSEEIEEYQAMSGELTEIAADSIQIASFSGTSEGNSEVNSDSYGGKTISVSKGWRGDETTTANRPQAVTFELYASNSTKPIDTLTLTKDNVTISGGSTWKGTFAGKYPLYDDNGEKITYTVKEASVTAKDKNGKNQVYPLDA